MEQHRSSKRTLLVYDQNWSQETENSPNYEVNDGFHFLEIHSLPEKMMWPGMFLFLVFILIIIYKTIQEACPHWIPGNVRAKRRHRRKKKRSKINRLLRSQGLEPSSEEDQYPPLWKQARRNYSSSEEEDDWQIISRALARRERNFRRDAPTPSPPPRQSRIHFREERQQGHSRRRTPHHSTPRQPQYHRDASPVDPPCGRRARSLEPSLAEDRQGTQWGNARSASSESLHWTPSPRGRTYRCPSTTCQFRQTQTATTTAWLHEPPRHRGEHRDGHPSEARAWTPNTSNNASQSSSLHGGDGTREPPPAGAQPQHRPEGHQHREDRETAVTGRAQLPGDLRALVAQAAATERLAMAPRALQSQAPSGHVWTRSSERLI